MYNTTTTYEFIINTIVSSLAAGRPIYCDRTYFYRGQIIFAPILKYHQEPRLSRFYLYHTSQLLTQPPQKYFPYLLLQITYLDLDNCPYHYLVTLPLCLRCVGGEDQQESVKIEVIMVSWAYNCWVVSWSVSSVWFLFWVLWFKETQNSKNSTACRHIFFLPLKIPFAN